jgi:hypothetical protein
MKAALLLLALALTVGLLKTFYGPAAVNGATLLAVVLTIWGAVVGITAAERRAER